MATIVVLDDDDDVRSFVVRILQMKIHKVLDFPDPSLAFEQVPFDSVDLVISNLKMPTPGEEAVQTLRERGVQVPIIIIAALIDEDKRNFLRSLGVREFIEKPFKVSDILETVEKWV